MNDHVSRKFPERVSTIRALAECDETFRTILANYEELRTWLATLNRKTIPDLEELDHASNLARDLENEIVDHLKKHSAADNGKSK